MTPATTTMATSRPSSRSSSGSETSSSSLKSDSGKRHNVDFSGDDVQNWFSFGWWTTYNQRALLARILYSANSKKNQNIQLDGIKRVKFFTKEHVDGTKEAPGYKWINYSTNFKNIEDFYQFIRDRVKSFELPEFKSDHWENIVHALELLDYRYEKIEGVEFWKSNDVLTEEMTDHFEKLTLEQKLYISAFGGALKSDMTNGEAKWWIDKLIRTIIESTDQLSIGDVALWAPCMYQNTNTMIEINRGNPDDTITQLLYNEPYNNIASRDSRHSSSLSLSGLSLKSEAEYDDPVSTEKTDRRQRVVPDFIVGLLEPPGMFPLVFELKPARQESLGINQNALQMLSKMFFQDVSLGVVISPKSYSLSVMIKNEGCIEFAHTGPIVITTYKDKMFKLDLESLNNLCTFMYRVLIWSKKSKCLLNTKNNTESTKSS